MKFFLALLAIVACVCAEEEWKPKTADEIKTIRASCLEDTHLSEEQINKMKNFEFDDVEPVRKYLTCTAEKFGVFCSHEGYHADRLAKQFKMDLNEEDVKKIVEDCISKHPKGDNPNDVHVFQVHQCIMGSSIGDKVKAYVKKRLEEHH